MASKALQMFGIQFMNGALFRVFTTDNACELWKPETENHVLILKSGGEIVFKSPSNVIMSVENLTTKVVFEKKYNDKHESKLTDVTGKPLNN